MGLTTFIQESVLENIKMSYKVTIYSTYWLMGIEVRLLLPEDVHVSHLFEAGNCVCDYTWR